MSDYPFNEVYAARPDETPEPRMKAQLRELLQRCDIDRQLRAPTVIGKADEQAIREALTALGG